MKSESWSYKMDKRNTLRWVGHIQKIYEDRLLKKVFGSEVRGTDNRRRSLLVCDKRKQQYVRERMGGAIKCGTEERVMYR